MRFDSVREGENAWLKLHWDDGRKAIYVSQTALSFMVERGELETLANMLNRELDEAEKGACVL